MQHLLIGVYIFSFIIGFISVYHLNTQYNIHRYPFLKTYKYHILALNLVVLSLVATKYYNVNIVNTARGVGLIKMQYVADVLFLFQKGVEYFGIILIAYTLVTIHYRIQEQETGSLIKYTFLIILTVSAFAYGIGVTNFLNNKTHRLDLFCDIISSISFLVVISIFIFSLLIKRTVHDNPKYSIRVFLLFYLVILSVFSLQTLFRIQYESMFVAAFILSVNLFPLFWSKRNLQKETPNGFSLNINVANIERLVSEYHISDREREIFEYILQGYSNREIQRRLFLSPHTVKNHNYNLYKKLGVRNRGELLRKASENQCE